MRRFIRINSEDELREAEYLLFIYGYYWGGIDHRVFHNMVMNNDYPKVLYINFYGNHRDIHHSPYEYYISNFSNLVLESLYQFLKLKVKDQ